HGTAVLIGHTVHTGGGALDDLGAVEVGDRIIVQQAEDDLVYTAVSVTDFRKGRLARQTAEVLRQGGPGRLAVITCGDWDGSTYLSNIVVIAAHAHAVPLHHR
ncbi:MAG: class F sortase, partial [Nocardioidaceae bacterium]